LRENKNTEHPLIIIKKEDLLRLLKVFFIGIAFLVVLFPRTSSAQNRQVENMPTYDYAKYHFGFILAVNQMFFTIKPIDNIHTTVFDSVAAKEINADSAIIYSILGTPSFGFTVGIVGNLRLSNYFDLRFIPSLSFGERYIDYRFMKYRNDDPPTLIDIRKSIPSTFIELPLHIKYKSKRVNNYRAYILGGVNTRIDLASQAKKRKDAGVIQVKLNRADVYGELGVGFDFYFEWFKFGTELKMSYGFLDVLRREGNIYTDGIEKLNSKVFQLTFTFE
jgi:hypothetical protein